MTTEPHPRSGTRRRGRPRVATAAGPVALGALLGLLVACGSGQPTSPAGGESSDGTTPDADPTPTALALEPGAFVVGLPEGVGPQPPDAQAGAGRTSDPALLHVVTFGSSTCPAVPDDTARADADGAVTVTFPEPDDGPCTADFVPTTSVVALPPSVDPAVELVVTIGTSGQVTLPAGSQDVVWALGG